MIDKCSWFNDLHRPKPSTDLAIDIVITLLPVGTDESSCMPVCLYVCPLAYFRDNTAKLHEVFCTCCM